MNTPQQVYTAIYDYAHDRLSRHMNSTKDLDVMINEVRQYINDKNVEETYESFIAEIESLRDRIKSGNGYKEVSQIFDNGDILTVSCNLLMESDRTPINLTLEQTIALITSAFCVVVDGHPFYPYKHNNCSINFQWYADDLEYQIDIDDCNFINAVLNESVITIQYNMDIDEPTTVKVTLLGRQVPDLSELPASEEEE